MIGVVEKAELNCARDNLPAREACRTCTWEPALGCGLPAVAALLHGQKTCLDPFAQQRSSSCAGDCYGLAASCMHPCARVELDAALLLLVKVLPNIECASCAIESHGHACI